MLPHRLIKLPPWENGTTIGRRLPRCYLNVYVPNDNGEAGGKNRNTVVILSHGNATDVGGMDFRSRELATLWNTVVVAYDYTGFGCSSRRSGNTVKMGGKDCEVTTTEFDTYEDIKEVYEFVVSGEKGGLRDIIIGEVGGEWEVEGVVLYGQSVGSGPTVWLAGLEENSRRNTGICGASSRSKMASKFTLGNAAYQMACLPWRLICCNCVCMAPKTVKEGEGHKLKVSGTSLIRGIILHSPFESGLRVMTDNRVLGKLDIYDNKERISGVNCPVFIIHGTNDSDVPFPHGHTLAKIATDKLGEEWVEKWWVFNRGHNDCLEGDNLEEMGRRGNEFMDKCRLYHSRYGILDGGIMDVGKVGEDGGSIKDDMTGETVVVEEEEVNEEDDKCEI